MIHKTCAQVNICNIVVPLFHKVVRWQKLALRGLANPKLRKADKEMMYGMVAKKKNDCTHFFAENRTKI